MASSDTTGGKALHAHDEERRRDRRAAPGDLHGAGVRLRNSSRRKSTTQKRLDWHEDSTDKEMGFGKRLVDGQYAWRGGGISGRAARSVLRRRHTRPEDLVSYAFTFDWRAPRRLHFLSEGLRSLSQWTTAIWHRLRETRAQLRLSELLKSKAFENSSSRGTVHSYRSPGRGLRIMG